MTAYFPCADPCAPSYVPTAAIPPLRRSMADRFIFEPDIPPDIGAHVAPQLLVENGLGLKLPTAKAFCPVPAATETMSFDPESHVVDQFAPPFRVTDTNPALPAALDLTPPRKPVFESANEADRMILAACTGAGIDSAATSAIASMLLIRNIRPALPRARSSHSTDTGFAGCRTHY